MIEFNPYRAIFHGSIFYPFFPFGAKFRAWTDASERWEITAIMIQELSTASNGSYIKAGVLSDSRWPGVSILSIYHLSRPPHGRAHAKDLLWEISVNSIEYKLSIYSKIMFLFFGQRDKWRILSRSLEEICISLNFRLLSGLICSPECSAILLFSVLYSHLSDSVICN